MGGREGGIKMIFVRGGVVGWCAFGVYARNGWILIAACFLSCLVISAVCIFSGRFNLRFARCDFRAFRIHI